MSQSVESPPSQDQPNTAEDVQSAKPTDTADDDPTARFRGDGTCFKAKLIGIDDVSDSRGDKMCQDSILKLKAIVKAAAQHKQKIVINISLSGLKIINAMTAQVMHEHRVDRISFISRDLTDRRAFGYIYGSESGQHQFFAIKTAKQAEQVVLTLRDLFQVVYEMKKKQVEVATQNSEGSEGVQVAVSNDQATNSNSPLQQENISALKKEMENMHQMSDLDVFKNPYPENTPTSPNTPGLSLQGDMFAPTQLPTSEKSDYSDDLAALSMEALQPAANGGAKLTKDQILASFGQGVPASGMYQQQQSGFFQAQQQSMYVQQQPTYSPAQQPMYRPAAPVNPYSLAPQSQAPMGMFPPGPSPMIAPRAGAMMPPTVVQAQMGASQNPFGDAFGVGSPTTGPLLAPVNAQPNIDGSSGKDDKKRQDPFASLIPGLGSGSSSKKDMFKDFKMAKPTQ